MNAVTQPMGPCPCGRWDDGRERDELVAEVERLRRIEEAAREHADKCPTSMFLEHALQERA